MQSIAAAPIPSSPSFSEYELGFALARRLCDEERLRENEVAVISAFAHMFVGRRVYDLTDPRDGSTCRAVLRSVSSDFGSQPSLLVQAENDPLVSRRGPARVHLVAGLNWTTLSTNSRAEVLAVLGFAGRETNAAVALAAARGLKVTFGKTSKPAHGVRPGPVLINGATVYVPGRPYPVFPVAVGLDAEPAAYEALRSLRRSAPPSALSPSPSSAPSSASPSAPPVPSARVLGPAPAVPLRDKSPARPPVSAVNRGPYRFTPVSRKVSSR